MLLIRSLREFVAECKENISSIKSAKVIVTTDDLSKIMRDHHSDSNILMITILPEHDVEGIEDNYSINNICGFYFLEKTDYSDIVAEEYLNIFERTQQCAKDFLEKVFSDQEEGKYCGLFSNLSKSPSQVSPVKALSGCNGYFVSLEFKTSF